MQIWHKLRKPIKSFHWSTIQIKIWTTRKKLKRFSRKFHMPIKFLVTLRKELIMTNLENNSLSQAVAPHKQEVLLSIKTSSFKILIWVEQKIYSKNFSEEKILFQVCLKIKTTFLEVEVVSHNFNKAVSEEDLAEELGVYFSKVVLVEWVEVNQWARKLLSKMGVKKQLRREPE